MFDFITLNWNKLDSPTEWIGVAVLFGLAVGAVYIIVNQKKNQVVNEIDEKTINSYKNALDSTKKDLQSQLDHCSAQHNESQAQIDEMKKVISEQQGQINVLKEVPLVKVSRDITSIKESNTQILNAINKQATVLRIEKAK